MIGTSRPETTAPTAPTASKAPKKSRLRRAVVLGNAALAAFVLSVTMSTPAHADGPIMYAKDGAGKGYFKSYGDVFYINDTKADGHSAVIMWRTSSGRAGDDWDIDGAHNGWTAINRNLPEADTVSYRVCWGEWGTQYIEFSSCSSWATTQV
ncbi:hypothetical protein [Streptomyces sp. NPDC058953]|uniref:hypothetical protein n=1 Tax=unclassified Streptomyces TaxID=2593676 RepID=UPI003678B0F7